MSQRVKSASIQSSTSASQCKHIGRFHCHLWRLRMPTACRWPAIASCRRLPAVDRPPRRGERRDRVFRQRRAGPGTAYGASVNRDGRRCSRHQQQQQAAGDAAGDHQNLSEWHAAAISSLAGRTTTSVVQQSNTISVHILHSTPHRATTAVATASERLHSDCASAAVVRMDKLFVCEARTIF